MSIGYRTLAVLTVGLIVGQLNAASIIGPSPYLTLEDAPSEFTTAGMGMPFMAQDFEDPDGPWEMGFTIDVGRRIGPNHTSGDGVPVTDSVDGDDGSIDGDGTQGSSWFIPTASATITFDTAVKAAGFVLTDADPRATSFSVEAFDGDGNSLVAQTFDFDGTFMDGVFTGTTQEDRFFGVIPMAAGESIKSVKIGINSGSGIEIDHVQKFSLVPEPNSALLMLVSLIGLFATRRRR